MSRVCLIKYKDQEVGDIKFANQLALSDPQLAANIAQLSNFEKSLLRENRLSKSNGRYIIEARNKARSKLFDDLYLVSPNPLKDYEYVHSEDFKRHFGDWQKAQYEWLSGQKTWLQAVRSNRLDESLLDENLEPRVQALYPLTPIRDTKISNKKLNRLMEKAGIKVKIKLYREKTDEEVILDNFEEAKRLLGQEVDNVVGVIKSFRPDIINTLRNLDARTKAYYDSKDKSIVYVVDDFELKNLLEQLNIKKLCL